MWVPFYICEYLFTCMLDFNLNYSKMYLNWTPLRPTFVLGKDWSSVYARDDYIFSVI